MVQEQGNQQYVQGSQNVAQAMNGSFATVNVTNYHLNRERIDQLVALHTYLRCFEGYIARPEQEKQLSEKLQKYRGHGYVVLHGMSGSGKTWLATQVINELQQGEKPVFPGGILWGDLSDIELNHVLHYALGALQPESDENNSSYSQALREQFWYAVARQSQDILIVFDNVRDEHQLMRLLPSETQDLLNCCVLVICGTHTSAKSTVDNQKERSVWLNGFSDPEEVQHLFQQHLHLNKHEMEVYRVHINEISRHLGALPLLLTTAARDMRSRNIPPSAYLRSLQEQHLAARSMTQSIIDGLELVVRDLSDPQRRLFLFIGVLGQCSWSADMLASVAVRRPDDLQQDLDVLIDRGLVHTMADRRYQVNGIVHDFAQKLLAQEQAYIQRAAFVCLAHHCLDYASTLAMTLCKDPDTRFDTTAPHPFFEEAFVRAYRQRIVPEALHIGRVLEWARSEKNWSLLLRFADVSFAELLRHLVANSFETRLLLCLATVTEPVIWRRGKICEVGFQALISTEGLQCVLPDKTELHIPQSKSSAWRATLDQCPENRPHCELDLDIRAGQIIDGLFEEMGLFDTEWLGVRATGLICRRVEFVGCVFAACDLSQSVWVACNARQIAMMGTNLSYALLRDSEFHRANLEDANLSGAVLEQVRLRGANLRNANFTGALLDNVDMRGADLRGARFTDAVLVGVNIRNCRVEGVDWNGIRIADSGGSFACDEDLRHVLARGRSAEGFPPHRRQAALAKVHSIHTSKDPEKLSSKDRDLNSSDLRAIRKEALAVSQCLFFQADFRAAGLEKADFSLADLKGANLRAAHLRNAHFLKANLHSADLRTADLSGANLEGADLTNARLRMAILETTGLQHVQLRAARLCNAMLTGAHLDNAILIEADLSYADLSDASLLNADMQRATLCGARLCRADLQGICLEKADCTGANFTEARNLDHTILARASEWKGAVLPDGRQVLELAGKYQGDALFPQDEAKWLRLAYLTGIFTELNLSEQDLCGTQLVGTFNNVSFAGARMDYARLSGTFSTCDLSGARLNHVHISGLLYKVDFNGVMLDGTILSGVCSHCAMVGVSFEGASLDGASVTNCDLFRAHITETQLQQTKRLRGTHLPDGSTYDGAFELPGDLLDAARFGYDLRVPEERQEFYKGGLLKVREP